MKNAFFFICSASLLIAISSCTKVKNSASKCSVTVTDIDGNIYPVVPIGDKCWMAANLTTSHFRTGNAITETSSTYEWRDSVKTSRWCNYNNDDSIGEIYGKLYNWNVVIDPRGVCPTGWHVPSSDEAIQLFKDLGGKDLAGGAMKANEYWDSPNVGATNSSGFSAFASGYRYPTTPPTAEFRLLGQWAVYWTSDPEPVNDTITAMSYGAVVYGAEAFYTERPRNAGQAIRCVED